MNYKVYVLEDDESIRELVTMALEMAQISIKSFSKISDFLEAIDKELPIVILLDIMLPDGNGLDVLTKVKAKYPHIQCIMLSALSQELDKVKGLNSGADDYITKPFSIRELKLRIMAQLRRQSQFNVKRERIIVDEWKLDVSNHMFFYRDILVDISNTEFTLLKHLMQNKNCLVSRQVLLNDITELNDTFVEDNTLTVYISRLKNKLIQTSSICPIETIRGVGYRWKEESA